MSSVPVELSVPNQTDTLKGPVLHRQPGSIQRIFLSCILKVETLARVYPLVLVVGVVTLLFAAVIWAMPPAYQTNDDSFMSMIASGQGIALEPDEHLVFTNVIIGKLLKSLYTRYPGMLWYGWYLVATQWAATIGLLYCFLRPPYSRLRMLGFAAYFFTAGIYFLVNLQFTSTSILAGIAGVMLVLQLLRSPMCSEREKFAMVTAATLLMVWAGLIRNDSYALTVLLASPVLLAAYWFGSASRQVGLAVIGVMGLATSFMFLAESYHQECYDEPGWKTFYQYNSLRVKFNDENWVEYTPETKHVFDQVGWSKNDYEMIKDWYFDDPIYDQKVLNSILTTYPWNRDRNVGKVLSKTVGDVFRNRTIQAIICCVPIVLILIGRNQQWYWLCFVAAITAAGLLLTISLLRKTPPERVFVPTLTFPWLVLLSSLATNRQGGELVSEFSLMIRSMQTAWQFRNWSLAKSGWRRHLALRCVTFLFVVGLSLNLIKHYKVGKDNLNNFCQFEQIMAELRPATNVPERLILAFAGDFPFEYQPAIYSGSDYRGLFFYSLSWPQRTPIAERMKQHFKLQCLGQALAEKHDMLLILNSSSYSRVMEYLAEHYSRALRMVNLSCYPRGSLSKLEHIQSTPEKQSSESAALSAKPNLDPNKSR